MTEGDLALERVIFESPSPADANVAHGRLFVIHSLSHSRPALVCDHDMLSHSRLAAANSNRHRTYEARTIKAVDLRLSDIHAAPLLATTAGPRRTSTTPCSMPDGQDGFQDHSSSLNYISRRRLAALGMAVLAGELRTPRWPLHAILQHACTCHMADAPHPH